MITPRNYISYSQIALWERSPDEYARNYIYGEKQRETRNMALGSALADGLERGEVTGDPILDLVMSILPKFELMDVAFEAYLKNGKETITLLAKPDTCKSDYSAFKEFKTSTRRWTQKMVDQSSQITFYTTAIWLKTGKIPKDIELICVKTSYDEHGELIPTDDIFHFRTHRSLTDIIKMTKRIRVAWAGIKALCEKELL